MMSSLSVRDPVIRLDNVSKVYKTYSNPRHRLAELLSGGRRNFATEVRALDDISLDLERGSRLGIVGHNGSGKSTLLKIICGVLTPSSGSALVHGRISALLELGAGFNPDLTGYDNILSFCMLHGMSREQVNTVLPKIIEFTELEDAIYQPVKTYSSGMAVRLGFSCAVHVEPEILIVDEALSVGDAYFQNKCLHKIKSLLDDGVTFIYVTHSADSVRSLCEIGLWLDKGKVREFGSAASVGSAYQREVFARLTESRESERAVIQSRRQKAVSSAEVLVRRQEFSRRVEPLRVGTGEARITDIEIFNGQDVLVDALEFSSLSRVRVSYEVISPLQDEYGLTLGITDSFGNQIVHFNSLDQGVSLPREQAATGFVDFVFTSQLCPGEYGLISGIGRFPKDLISNGRLMFDQIVDGCFGGARFSIFYPDSSKNMNLWGVIYTPSVILGVVDNSY